MKLRKEIFAFILGFVLITVAAHAAVERREFDLKLPSQQQVEKQTIPAPALGASGAVLNDNAGNTSAAAVLVSSGFTQPDVPRAISITPGGTTADVAACTITVTGKNIQNQTISDTFAFAANASTVTTGTKAFKSITSVSFPAACEDSPFGATWDVDTTDKLGLRRCMDKAGHALMTTFAGAYETTRATVTADNDEVEKNTVDPNGTLDATKDLEVFYFQNFRCKP